MTKLAPLNEQYWRAEYEAEAIIARIYKAIGAEPDESIVLDSDAKAVIRDSLLSWGRGGALLSDLNVFSMTRTDEEDTLGNN